MATGTPHDVPAAVALGYWQDRDPMEALDTARHADLLGYDELWLGEMATFDAVALAVAVGRSTVRISLTLGPFSPAVRDPASLAMGAATVAALTGRTTRLALGASSPVVVEHWHGRSTTANATAPVAGLRVAVEELRALLAGGRSSGGYRLRLPAPGADLTLAAFGPATVRLAGRVADRMVINMCTPEGAAGLRAQLDAAAAAAGRDRVPLAAWVPAAVDPTPEGIAQIRRGLTAYVAAPGYGEMFAAAGFAEVVAFARSGARPAEVLAAIPDEMVHAVALVGSREECAARVREHVVAGVDEVVIVPVTAGDDGGRRTLTALAPRPRGALADEPRPLGSSTP